MSIFEKIYLNLVTDRWTLGFIEESPDSIVSGKPYEVHYVSGISRKKWYADPFILDINDNTIELLVEEYRYFHPKGRIAKITINRQTYQLLDERIILELETHLSFPFIQRLDGKILVCPENSESGGWHQYEYDPVAMKLIYQKTLINKPLTDAIAVSFFSEPLVFSTSCPIASGSLLSVYDSWGSVINTIEFNSNVARGAGDWFSIGNRIFRPAQDCNGGYGKAVILQEVNRVNGSFVFQDILRMESQNPKFSRGMHTFNHYGGICVVDFFGYRWDLVGRITDKLKSIIKRLISHVK